MRAAEPIKIGLRLKPRQVAKQDGAQMHQKLCAVIMPKYSESEYHDALIRGTNIAFNIPLGNSGVRDETPRPWCSVRLLDEWS